MQQYPYPGMNTFFQQPAPQGPAFTTSQIRQIARSKLSGKWKKAAAPLLIYAAFTFIPTIIYAISSFADIASSASGTADLSAAVLNSVTGAGETEQSYLSGFLNDFLSLYQIITAGAFGIGISALALNIIRDEQFSVSTMFTGFKKFGQSFLTGLMVNIFSMLWMCLFILPGSFMLGISMGLGGFAMSFLAFATLLAGIIGGIMFTLRYDMSYFIASDDRNMRASAAVAYSVAMMRKRTMDLFMLDLSFIGWLLLSAVPLYLAMLTIAFAGVTVMSCAGALVFGILFVIIYSFVLLYMTTAKAVFYSTATGNFKAQPSQAAQPEQTAQSAVNS